VINPKTSILILTAGILLCLGESKLLYAQIHQELTPEQIKELNDGKELLITKEVNKTWPEIIIYRKIDAPANIVAELFLDYEEAHTYVPNVKAAKIENSQGENTKDVRYTVKPPIIKPITYLVRNTYQKTKHGHKISWNLLESQIVNSAVGNLRIESLDKSGNSSVICYKTHVEPATSLLAGLRGYAIREASNTVASIAKKAESLAQKNEAK
jgi:hypothetical protein